MIDKPCFECGHAATVAHVVVPGGRATVPLCDLCAESARESEDIRGTISPRLFGAFKRELAAAEDLDTLTAVVHRAAHAYGMAKPGQLQPETWELDAEDLAGELPDLVALLNVAVLRREFLGEPRSALGDAVQDWHRLESCPDCGDRAKGPDVVLNVGREHWGVCHTHRTKWRIGENLFSGWRDETPEQWERNARLLETYREVDTE